MLDPEPALSADVDPATLAERLRAVTELLERMAVDPGVLEALPADEQRRLLRAVAAVYSPDRNERRRLLRSRDAQRRAVQVALDEATLAETGIRSLRRKPVFTTPNYYPPAPDDPVEDRSRRESVERRHCYVCKQPYSVLHHFYDQLCPPCAALSFAKRTELADLRGRVALLTGGRVKIGYQTGLKLLRSGARLLVTTRFPVDSAARYAREPDFLDWKDRLEVFGLDLRHTPSVEAFCRELLTTRDRLDFIVNNACQTVRRPPEFYSHMMAGEAQALGALPEDARPLLAAYDAMRGHALGAGGSLSRGAEVARKGALSEAPGLTHAAALSQIPLLAEELLAQPELFPGGRLDQDLQQVDLRERNSWRLLLAEVSSVELLEVQLVNAVAPFILNARLKPLLMRTPERDKHIVNVSAVEGQFYRNFKTTRHPHTNMAKAALNMMTRTSAADYQSDGIHMNSVDTGWVTDEDAAPIAAKKVVEQRFHPPLDIVDGAARILDPIIDGFRTGTHVWGQFLKDFRPTDW